MLTILQLIGSLSAVAETMRTCANIAEQFAQMVSQVSYAQGAPTNGQFAVPAVPLHAAPGRGKRKAADDTDGPKAKRVKKPRDPNAPKRPASSYLLFQNEVRQQLKDKNPTLPNNELLSLIAKMWKEMPKEQKDVRPSLLHSVIDTELSLQTYEARQKMAKEEWIVNKTAYQASMDAQEHTPSESPVAVCESFLVHVRSSCCVGDTTCSCTCTCVCTCASASRIGLFRGQLLGGRSIRFGF